MQERVRCVDRVLTQAGLEPAGSSEAMAGPSARRGVIAPRPNGHGKPANGHGKPANGHGKPADVN
jgi:hypothetical protein